MAYIYDREKKEYVQRVIAEISNTGDIGGGGGSSMRFLFGESDPTESDGQPGDVFLNTNSGDIFSNDNGTWNLQGNLQGPQGIAGAEGEQGPPGNDGTDGEQGPPGSDGADGFGTETQYNDIISRLEALEDVE